MDQSNETLSQVRNLLSQMSPDMLQRATFGLGGSTTSPLTYYDLEEEAKIFVPEITPLVRRIPRVKGLGGTATQWDSITALNSGALPMGVLEGKRAGIQAITSVRNVASYATIGLESSLTFEQDLAGMGFDDMKALQIRTLLQAARIGEEQIDLGGNSDVALGTNPTPTLTPANTGGSLTNAASPYYIRIVPLTLAAYKRSSLTAGIPTTHAYTRGGGATTTVNAGAGQVSASANATIASGTTGSIAATWTAVKGAVAYAVFIGTDGTTNCRLAAITTVNAATLTAVPSAITPGTGFAGVVGTNFDSDLSANNLVYNGLISIIAKSGSNSLFASSDNAQLSTDNAGGCTQINTDLQAFWDNYRVSPTAMLVSAQTLLDLSTLVVKNGGAPLIRFQLDGTNRTPNANTITAGSVVGFYMNKTAQGGGQMLEVILHPDMPPGMILYYSDRISYPVPGVTNILQVKTQEEWRQIDWPLVEREYGVGVYARQVLQCYYPPAFGMRCNIKAGIA
jgi:hypothetical protein